MRPLVHVAVVSLAVSLCSCGGSKSPTEPGPVSTPRNPTSVPDPTREVVIVSAPGSDTLAIAPAGSGSVIRLVGRETATGALVREALLQALAHRPSRRFSAVVRRLGPCREVDYIKRHKCLF